MYDFLNKKKSQGKIRHLGFSVHDNPKLLEEITANYSWEFAPIQLNYLDWELQDAARQYEILTNHKIPVIVMEPVRGGALATLNEKTLGNFKPLTEADRETLKQAADAYKASGTIPCTNCRYCSDCPAGVTIPRIFSHYNLYQINKNKNTFKGNYRTLVEREKAHNCVNCGHCVDHCPQGIKIPELLKEIAAFAAAG